MDGPGVSAQARHRDELVAAILRRLARAGRFRDEETAEHVERMSRSCALIARALGQSQDQCMNLRAASALHDLGKVGIPDAVLRKPGGLRARERVLIEQHPDIGHEILADADDELFELAASIALTHHERVDGAGYPRGLTGSEIPLEGRIAAVADVFDALTHDRIYRPAFEPGEALETMRKSRGTQFDNTVFDAFESVLPEVLKVSRQYPDSAHEDAPEPAAEIDPDRPLSVLVVDDHAAVAKGLSLLLRREGIEIAGSAQTLDNAKRLLKRRRADIAIVDVDLAGESGLDLIPTAHETGTCVLIYTGFLTADVLKRANEAGADGVASKVGSPLELLDAVRRMGMGESVVDPLLNDRVAAGPPVHALTPREREVVTLLAAGLTGNQIARQLFLSPDTVRTHVRNAKTGIGAKTQAHLVMLAAERNEIEAPERNTRPAA